MLAKGTVWKTECWYPGYPAETSSVTRVINPALVISKKTHLKKKKKAERGENMQTCSFLLSFLLLIHNLLSLISIQAITNPSAEQPASQSSSLNHEVAILSVTPS